MTVENNVTDKWASLIEHKDFEAIKADRRSTIAQLLENTAMTMTDPGQRSGSLTEATVATTGGFTNAAAAAGPVAGFDPVLISLVRRAMPKLVAFDIMGVQPMTGPTGMIFAMRAKYDDQNGAEAFYNEANTAWSGTGTHANTTGQAGVTSGTGMATGVAEVLGNTPGTNDWNEMSVAFERVTATARSRKLKAEFTNEFAQDLKSVHGFDAETLLSNILSGEIIAEINREAVRTVYTTAVAGAQDTATAGTFDLDVDADGRWFVEKAKGLMYQLEKEANAIAKATRRGRGNIIIASSNVASALAQAGILDYAPAIQTNLEVDDTGNLFAGVVSGKYKLYVDPFAGGDFAVMGYRGASQLDAGLFYCPYVPLQFTKAVDTRTMQPVIGFQTRYALVANPFAEGSTQGLGRIQANSNVYYRRLQITGI